jgi:D-tyrosyl-tRNA(Tyr) deacylase
MAEKIAHLRLFENEAGRFDRSLLDVSGALLVVSQFTLYADCRKGRRPSFTEAASPEDASPLIGLFLEEMARRGISVSSGQFRERMEVSLVNDGPVTVWLEVAPISAGPGAGGGMSHGG